MSTHRLFSRWGLWLLMAASITLPAHAAPYSAIYAFGDSLSDNGQSLTGQPNPPSPNVGGRFSNGPVAVERLADGLAIPLRDYAVSGATTGLVNTDFGSGNPLHETGMLRQIDAFAGSLTPAGADAQGLYVLAGGANDFLIIDPTDPAAVAQTAFDAVSNLQDAVLQLYGLGARNFLLALMPDLGLTPMAAAFGAASELSLLSEEFNLVLADSFNQLMAALPDAMFIVFDTLEAQRAVVAESPGNGITNITDPCFDMLAATVCSDPNSFFFWDQEHPTAAVSALVGDRLLAAATAVPEPSSTLLVALAGLALVASRRRARPAAV